MHMLIRVITKADSAQEAFNKAENFACDRLCREGGPFDWYDMNGRWGASKAYKFTGKKGQELLAEGMQEARKDFDSAMAHVRHMLDNYSDDQIYNEQFDKVENQPEGIYYVSRYQFTKLGQHDQASWVYGDDDIWGEAITSDRELEQATKRKDKASLWVVPIDMHY